MTRSKCGLLLLLAAGLGACGGDPTESFKEEGQKIVADPAVVFVNQGASVFVVTQLQDNQGNQLATDFDATPLSGGVAVERDTTFLQTTNGQTLKTRERFLVSGVAPGATAVEIAGGSLKDTVPVNVIPTSVAATFSNPTPAANEAVTITLPAGYTFSADASVETDVAAGFVTGISEDGTSITALLPPGSSGPVTLGGVNAAFLPGLSLTAPSIDPVTVAAVTPQAGTGSTSTAPTLTVAPPGGTTTFYDGGTYDYGAPLFDTSIPARLYKFTVPADGDFTVTIDWTSPEDLGVYYFEADGSTETGSAADAGGGGAHPESSTSTFTAGTYFMAVVNFSGTNPPFYSIQFTTELPESGE